MLSAAVGVFLLGFLLAFDDVCALILDTDLFSDALKGDLTAKTARAFRRIKADFATAYRFATGIARFFAIRIDFILATRRLSRHFTCFTLHSRTESTVHAVSTNGLL
ncbi:hypothetical protein XA67_24080 [Comamonas thiooxydans]|nr:hypothetical protein XA67_24080 [Comamonas thiooxydans]